MTAATEKKAAKAAATAAATAQESLPSSNKAPAAINAAAAVAAKKPKAKRKRATTAAPSKRSKAIPAASAAGSSTTASSTTTPSLVISTTPPPADILLIDNGGDTIKYGFLKGQQTQSTTTTLTTQPQHIQNVTARLRHQWTVLVGDEIDTVQPTQLESMTRSMERGCISNMGNQVQVWKRILDKLRIHVPLTSEAAQAFGWKVSRKQPSPNNKSNNSPLVSPLSLAVVIMVSPLCPRSIIDKIVAVWFQDFGFSHVGIVTTSLFGSGGGAVVPSPTTTTECCLVVDCGWSAIQVVPTHQNRVIRTTQSDNSNKNCSTKSNNRMLPAATPITTSTTTIRRLPLGGRHLIGLWKYYCSYRQWNLMDADFLLQDLHHALSYVSLEFSNDLALAQRAPLGRRPFDREFVLPDFQTTYKGFARLTPQLQRSQDVKEEEAAAEKIAQVEADRDDHHEDPDDSNDDDENGHQDRDSADNDGDSDEDVDSDEETEDQKRKRLVKQRQEEERRRQELEAERQVLLVSVERFTIPEVLFHPSDAGFTMAGLPQTIVASIQACPRIYHSALYGSIRLIGGMSKLKNLEQRLYRELRALAPAHYDLKITTAEDPVNDAWMRAKSWIQATPLSHAHQWSISRAEFEASQKAKDPKKQFPWHRFLENEGGKLV